MGEVGGEAIRELRGELPEPRPDSRRALGGEEELAGGQQVDGLGRPDRALVGRVEVAEAGDLVAEELDPDRQVGACGEDVHQAAPTHELAAPGNLDDRLVAQPEELREECTLGRRARHGASAATRAADSSRTSSLRSYASADRGSRTATAAGSPIHATSSSATRSPISASRAIQQTRSPPARANAAARNVLAPWGTGSRPRAGPGD